MHQVSSDGYAFVAVYLRTDNPSIARFVIGASHGHGFLLSERAVEARSLITSSDLDAQWKSSECPTIVWKHNADAFKREESNLSMTSTSAIGIRVYSSDTIVNRVRYSVHIYDTNESDFTVELISKPKKDKYAHGAIPSSASNRVILLKRKVNPYDVHLSSSNFADLLSLTRFEQTPSRNLISNGAETDDRDGFGWKATVSPKWAGKLANYVRVFRLAKYASKVGGVFCFVTVFVVQQKTEFRAHLLLEVTWLASTLSSSCSLGGVDTRQSLRIPLSEYLRCVNVSRRLTLGVGYGHSASEGGDKCTACLAYTATRARFYDSAASSTPETAFEYSSSCSTCSMIQYRRLHAIRELLNYAAATAPESLEFIYHAYCEHETKSAFFFNADCGVTVASANLFVNDLHWWLYPDCSELPCHVAYIVPGKENGFEHIPEKLQRDFDLVEALQALNHAACQVAELTPVHLDDAGDGATDHASAFDAYLVAEAVLVEATRVLLHPDYAWQKPRKIVGASSWSTACSFLLGPVQLSAALQRFDPLYLNPATAEVLEAYFTHEKWPHDYPNVRPFFYGILAFMTHVQRVRQILVLRSGALQISSAPKHATDGENTSNHETLAKNTSVLDCSLQSNSTKVLGSLTLVAAAPHTGAAGHGRVVADGEGHGARAQRAGGAARAQRASAGRDAGDGGHVQARPQGNDVVRVALQQVLSFASAFDQ
ncbi:hypothetical protein ON010_g16004 [Phytophthora cinnamomi]|nr:hypothetical protein ON010_g16004 [Phytophthora cinnamomi]